MTSNISRLKSEQLPRVGTPISHSRVSYAPCCNTYLQQTPQLIPSIQRRNPICHPPSPTIVTRLRPSQLESFLSIWVPAERQHSPHVPQPMTPGIRTRMPRNRKTALVASHPRRMSQSFMAPLPLLRCQTRRTTSRKLPRFLPQRTTTLLHQPNCPHGNGITALSSSYDFCWIFSRVVAYFTYDEFSHGSFPHATNSRTRSPSSHAD
jgi:hypothetical protein